MDKSHTDEVYQERKEDHLEKENKHSLNEHIGKYET